uniref:Uncharacterized protein n=1 Tax=Rhodosorus marinus TaxID=101924 RepID=A0A7S3A8F1_9RHOD
MQVPGSPVEGLAKVVLIQCFSGLAKHPSTQISRSRFVQSTNFRWLRVRMIQSTPRKIELVDLKKSLLLVHLKAEHSVFLDDALNRKACQLLNVEVQFLNEHLAFQTRSFYGHGVGQLVHFVPPWVLIVVL